MQILPSRFILVIGVFASTAVFAGESRVSFDSDVKVSTLSKDGLSKDEAYEANKEVKLQPNTIYWVSSSGKVPLLVTPQTPGDQEAPAKLRLPDVATWPSEVASQQLQSKLATIIDQLYAFQTALAKKDTAEAEKILNQMEAIQPMDYYSFLRASLAFVKGDMKTAKDQVQRGLKRYPANEAGSKLLKTIEGAGK